jgi:cell division protein FtsB
MDGSQPSKVIDPQMIRDHGAEMETLAQEIRDIEAEALDLQNRLSLASPMPRPHARHWWQRRS